MTKQSGVVSQAAASDLSDPRLKEMPKHRDRPDTYTGKCFVVKDNIDTDQIIPAEYLTLVPSKVRFSMGSSSLSLPGVLLARWEHCVEYGPCCY